MMKKHGRICRMLLMNTKWIETENKEMLQNAKHDLEKAYV